VILLVKTANKPDKMIVVSSTGSTEDAELYAAKESVDLITVSRPTKGTLKEWFKMREICYTDWDYAISKPCHAKSNR
jgi:hypothetical protein